MMMSVVMDTVWNSVVSPITVEGGSDCHWTSKGERREGMTVRYNCVLVITYS